VKGEGREGQRLQAVDQDRFLAGADQVRAIAKAQWPGRGRIVEQ